MTRVEIMAVVVTLGILALLLVQSVYSAVREVSFNTLCINNLKQIGLAFRIYATDHDDRFPAATTDAIQTWALEPYSAYMHFRQLNNEGFNPRFLVCRGGGRPRKYPSSNFSGITNNNHVSYFVGLVRDETNPRAILSGDRDITNSTRPINGFLTLSTNDQLGWTGASHKQSGNIVLADETVHQTTSAKLDAAFKSASGIPFPSNLKTVVPR